MANTIYEITGIVHKVGDEQVFAEGRFKKREVVIILSNMYKDKVYEEFITIEFQNTQTYECTGVNPGNKVKIAFVLQGREAKRDDLKGRFFNTIKGIKLETLEATTTGQRIQNEVQDSQQRAINDFVEPENTSLSPSDGPDDLPF